jgi:hypothetical protein
MSEVEDALAEMVTIVKTIGVSVGPGSRVWRHPGETASISLETLPAVVVAKTNAEPGAWDSRSYGTGMHAWSILIAVYLNDGPITVTNSDDITIAAMANASEWYKELADILYANMTLNGSVQIIGDGEGRLFDYVTDNIIWNARQHWGHLFIVPVVQEVAQNVSS